MIGGERGGQGCGPVRVGAGAAEHPPQHRVAVPGDHRRLQGGEQRRQHGGGYQEVRGHQDEGKKKNYGWIMETIDHFLNRFFRF